LCGRCQCWTALTLSARLPFVQTRPSYPLVVYRGLLSLSLTFPFLASILFSQLLVSIDRQNTLLNSGLSRFHLGASGRRKAVIW